MRCPFIRGATDQEAHDCEFMSNLAKSRIATMVGYRQAVRHKTLTLACDSSNLSTPANGGYSSVGRAPDCGSGCRGFESLYPPHIRHYFNSDVFFIFLYGTRTKVRSCRSQTAITDCSRSLTKNLPLATFLHVLTPLPTPFKTLL